MPPTGVCLASIFLRRFAQSGEEVNTSCPFWKASHTCPTFSLSHHAGMFVVRERAQQMAALSTSCRNLNLARERPPNTHDAKAHASACQKGEWAPIIKEVLSSKGDANEPSGARGAHDEGEQWDRTNNRSVPGRSRGGSGDRRWTAGASRTRLPRLSAAWEERRSPSGVN